MIPKSDFEFSSGGSNVLEIAFLAMEQINDISRITRTFLCNHICFASIGIDEKILTKIASGLIAFETARCLCICCRQRAVSSLRRC